MVISVVALVIAAAACYKAVRRWQAKGGGAYECTHKGSSSGIGLDTKKNVWASFDSLAYHRKLGIRQAQSAPLGGEPHRWKITDDEERKIIFYKLKKEGKYPPFLMLKICAVFPKLNEKFSKTICALITALNLLCMNLPIATVITASELSEEDVRALVREHGITVQ